MDAERKLFLMRVLTPTGRRMLWVPEGSDDASKIGSHWNAIKRFRNGKQKDLKKFKDVQVKGLDPDSPDMNDPRTLTLTLASDPDQIKKWAKQGELDSVDPYSELDGGGDA